MNAQSTSILHYDVKARIDSLWGSGLPAHEELRLFDSLWTLLDQNYACFQNLDVDWNAVRTKYRPEIARGVSRGRFASIISQFTIRLKEPHTFVFYYPVSGIDLRQLRRGIPLMIGGDGRICGASLSPLTDSTLLVYNAQKNHPLGLSPGDIILGYDGVSIRQLVQYLKTLELPLYSGSNFGGTDEANTYNWLQAAGSNWRLFDTIDVVKYQTGQTLHLSTRVLDTLDISVKVSGRYTDQIPVRGITYPAYPNTISNVSWGMVDGTNIGYVYVWSWLDGSSQIRFYNALDSLIRINRVSGLVLDFRCNTGGYVDNSDAGLGLLFKSAPHPFMLATRANPSDHLQMYSPFGWSFDSDSLRSFDRPIAVLTGPHCISAGEIIALRMKEHPSVRVFGLTTAGGYASPDEIALDSGVVGRYAWANGFIDKNDGNPNYLTHQEFPVDEKVWHTPDAVAKGEDAVVNAALRWIRTATGVSVEKPMTLPTQFALGQNYPNPFNPSTTILVQVPIATRISVVVYDALGRVVRTLIDDEKAAGTYKLTFEATGLSSGMYFYRLQAGVFSETKRLLLIR